MIRSSWMRPWIPVVLSLGSYAAIGGVVSFCGWVFDFPRLADWDNDGISIQPNATLCAAFSGLALILLITKYKRAAAASALPVVVLGASTLLEWVTGLSFGHDDLLLFGRDWGRVGVIYPGRMGPPGSLSWTVIGLALLMSAFESERSWRRVPPLLAMLTGVVSAVSLVGYLYAVDPLYSVSTLTVIAVQTSTFVMAMSLGILAFHPDREPLRTLMGSGNSEMIARRVIPLLLGAAIGLGFLSLKAQDAHLIDARMGVAILVLSLIILSVPPLWLALSELRRRERKQREREIFIDGLIGSVTDAFVALDADWRYIYLNEVALRRFGLPSEQVFGRNAWDLFPAAIGSAAYVQLSRAMRERVPVECETYYEPWQRWYFDRGYPTADGGLAIYSVDITERKQSELALHESEQRLLMAKRAAQLGIHDFDVVSGVIHWDQRTREFWGVGPDEPINFETFRAGLHPDDVTSSQMALDQALDPSGSGDYYAEYRVINRHDGMTRWVAATGEVSFHQGRAVRLVGTVQDITKRKQTELALRESDERFRLSLRGGNVIIAQCDSELKYVWIHNAHPDFDSRSVIGKRDTEIDDNEGTRQLESLKRTVSDTRMEARSEITFPVGPVPQTYDIQAEPRVSASGKLEAIVTVGVNVTERKKAEQTIQEALADSQLLHRLTMDMAKPAQPEELYERLLDAAVEIMNSDFASLQMLHPNRGTPSGKGELQLLANRGFPQETWPHWEWVRADSACACGIALDTGRRCDVLNLAIDPRITGEDRAVYARMGIHAVQTTPLVARDGRILGAISTHWKSPRDPDSLRERNWRMLDVLAQYAADLLERQQAEEALRYADRRKDEFLATLAHELRNPLAPIRNSLNILRLAGKDVEAHAPVVEMMDRQVSHMVRLVDDLLEISRITSGKIELRKETMEVAALVRGAVENVSSALESAGHQLAISMPPEPILLDADAVRLTQVLANLLGNAIKYTSECGQIWLTVREEEQIAIISVRDNGTGIPSEMLPRVFELFTQVNHTLSRAQGGLGIGLALVKSLVEMYGGSVSAHSGGPGQGSEFVVRLPVAVALGAANSTPQSRIIAASGSTTDHRILVVDDNRDAADSFAMVLRFLGMDVQTVYDGTAALEAVRVFQPAIVFLDIGMPGMDGYAVAARIRSQSHFQKTRLVALTGWGQEEDRRRTKAAGFDHHLTKPPNIESVQQLFASLSPTESGLAESARTESTSMGVQ